MAGVSLKITIPAYQFDDKDYISQLRKVFRQAGQEVAAEAKKLIRKSQGSGRIYGPHQASAPGQPPTSYTGNLARSIKVKATKNGLGATITDYAFYALALEAGGRGGGNRVKKAGRNKRQGPTTTRVLEPRPFLSVALENVASKDLQNRIQAAVNNGIKLKEVK